MEEVKQPLNDVVGNHEDPVGSKQSHPKMTDLDEQEKLDSKKSSSSLSAVNLSKQQSINEDPTPQVNKLETINAFESEKQHIQNETQQDYQTLVLLNQASSKSSRMSRQSAAKENHDLPEDPPPITSTIVNKKIRKTELLPPVQELPKPEPLTEE